MVYIDKMLLPIAPSSISISTKNMNETIKLIENAEFNLIKPGGLKDISFKFMLPSQRYPFARYLGTYKRPNYFIDKLSKLKKNAKPFQLIIIRTYPSMIKAYFNTNIKVSLEDFSIDEDAEDGMDVMVNVKFKEFIDPRPQTVKLNPDGTANLQNQRWTDKVEQQICSTKAGQTIWQFVREETGGLDQLQTVVEVNGISSLTNFVSDKLRMW